MKSSTTLAALVASCRKMARRHKAPDAELLRRFAGHRDAAAFEELVERYAPLVWGVCRRMLSSEADCEDAFQAAFLVLVRRANSIAAGRPLGAWLHTVAVHVSDKTRARVLRQPRQTITSEPAIGGDVADELEKREMFCIVDEEIARLPTLLREPFVLCGLEGRSRDEAAAELGCSVAAVKSRLERSRNVLRQRLQRRGFGLPAAFLLLGLTGEHVRASLRAKVLHCVFGSAPAAISALVPAAGVSLTKKLTGTALALVVAGTLGLGSFWGLETESPKDSPAPAKDIAPKSPQPRAAEKSEPRLDRFGDPLPPGAIRRFGTLRFRHAVGNEELAFTPDGKRLIAGWGSRPLAVFDAMTGRKLRDVGKLSPSRVAGGFAVSPDGKWIAACGADVFLWEIETGRLVRELQCPDCRSVAFSADGKVLAAVGWTGRERMEITLVELATGKHLEKWTLEEGEFLSIGSHPLAFSPDGKYLAGLFCKRREVKPNTFEEVLLQVRLLDAKNGSRVRTFDSPRSRIGAFAFQPGTRRLATFEENGVLRFWDVETGKEVHHISIAQGKRDSKVGRPPDVLRFSAEGHRCAVADGVAGLLVVVDARTGREVRRIETEKTANWITADLSPDGRAIASARTVGASCVRVWDVDPGVERLGDAGHRTPPMLSLSTDERTLIGRSEDGQAIHWDRQSGQAIQRRNETPEQTGRPVRPLGTLGEWTLRGPRWRLSFDFPTSTLAVYSLDGERLLGKTECDGQWRQFTLSPDGVYVAVPLQADRQGTVHLWNPEKEKQPRRLSGDMEDSCWSLLFSHDSKRLITGFGTTDASRSSVLWVWDVATARPIRKLATKSTPAVLLLTADDRVLIWGGLSGAAIHVWDMETGKELAEFTDLSSKERSFIGGLALSADERFLAVIFSQQDAYSVSVWETGSWKPVRMFPQTDGLNWSGSIVFSRDGRSLFVANSDSTILEWDVAGRFQTNKEKPNRKRLDVLWAKLTESPDKAYPAVWEMLDHPEQSLPFLRDKIQPITPMKEKRVRQLIPRLDSDSFVEREEANRQLLSLGEQIVPILRQALKERLALEVRKRVEGVIESLNGAPRPEKLRLLRALAVLEWSDRPEAVGHLRQLAGGAASASLTQAAKAAERRLQEKALGRPLSP
jgi:RNA polymerase sigma factor (sigma-70 family)